MTSAKDLENHSTPDEQGYCFKIQEVGVTSIL